MDDDTIPKRDAFNKLIEKANMLNDKFSFLCSYVEWINGQLCKMNRPKIDPLWAEKILPDKINLIPVESCSFVACLINLDYVEKVGLPIKEFFIYGDDLEYTQRLQTCENAYLVTDSVVIHKMPSNVSTNVVKVEKERVERYVYRYRNGFYFAKKRGVLAIIKEILICIRAILRSLFCAKDGKIKRITCVIKGLILGLKFNPNIEKVRRN